MLNTAECQALLNVPMLLLCLGSAFTRTSPMCDPRLAHLHLPCILCLFSFQTAWVLTSPGYSPSSLTSLPCSTLWTKWSVLLVSVPGTLKTMVALADLRWKGSQWMKLMSKSYLRDVLFCSELLSAPSCSDDPKQNTCLNDLRTIVKIIEDLLRE